ncbi:hypothetical protein K493DRAFT_271961 [Basidiobolus meristosporus CBS 931.73]|uniref:GST C-terminal domain-containing protein n=1 Tax=Basidiobolus meristosporus CBS 931.73 TaxID=1314790 RepID=A0A1Y1WP45_9FUNG|nr:hypothetical protein K493DRAFT_271961 [Basidiobolus meristosporus CBS 931.73]|eukprot:ORX75290.1 hypothetical protein K493DRAFT_271961 [Basidiobolus meristosporus CBS 931.73]
MVFELYTWGPGFELPSLDPLCLTIETYLNLTNASWVANECNNPSASPSGELPLLRDGKEYICGVNNILTYLSKQGLDLSKSLNDQQKAETLAYSALVNDRLMDGLLYAWYGDQENFTQITRPTYAKLLPLALRYYTPVTLRKTALTKIEKYGFPKEEGKKPKKEAVAPEIYELVRDHYRVLSKKLGEQQFFFGDSPTTLDAVVFGQLALHYYPELPNARLATMLKEEFPNLGQFCDRVRGLAFSKPVEKSSSLDTPSPLSGLLGSPVSWFKNNFLIRFTGTKEAAPKTPEQEEFERKRFLSIFGAAWFMIAFVVYNGIISIQTVEAEDEDDDEEYYELD